MTNLNDIQEIIDDLRDAREALDILRSEYAESDQLLKFYEPSAIELVRRYESMLRDAFTEVSGVDLNLENELDSGVDIWVRIEGEQFNGGQGPINQVASLLQSLNTANQHALALIENHKYTGGRFNRRIAAGAMFKLAATKAGSLQLGLRRPELQIIESDDLPLFPTDPWDVLKQSVENNERALKAFQLLMKALASVDNEEELNELVDELNPNGVVKLLHYAAGLTPSERSSIERISFEGKEIDIPSQQVIADKNTRQRIAQVASSLTRNRMYVTGTAVIRGQDLDRRSLVARPFVNEKHRYKELTCVFPKRYPKEDIKDFLDVPVQLAGFLSFNAHGAPTRLIVDEISEIESSD